MKQTARCVAVRRRNWTIALTAALAMAIAVLAALPARAQYDGFPVGDWRQYCNNARMDGNELKAHCRARNGQMVYVEANISSCGGVVSYDMGQTKFFCASRGNQGYPGGQGYYPGGQGFAPDGLPNGNWRQFCNDARMDGNELKAHCRAPNGQMVYVEANISSCGGVVSYNIGQTKFTCGYQGGQPGYGQNYGQGGNSGFPPGSWSQTCTNASMQGSLLRAQCRNNFGQYIYAQIDAYQCYNGVWNNNGQLRCQ